MGKARHIQGCRCLLNRSPKTKAFKPPKAAYDFHGLFALLQMIKGPLGIFLSHLQRAKLTNRNAGVLVWRRLDPQQQRKGDRIGRKLIQPGLPLAKHVWKEADPDLTQVFCFVFCFSLVNREGFFFHGSIRVKCNALASMGRERLSQLEEELFSITAHRDKIRNRWPSTLKLLKLQWTSLWRARTEEQLRCNAERNYAPQSTCSQLTSHLLYRWWGGSLNTQ